MPERPIECTECTRPIAIEYKELSRDKTVELSMCSACPVCQRLVHGSSEGAAPASKEEAEETGLCCGHCDTTLEEVRTGHPLGCPHCYEVFTDVINYELASAKRLAQRVSKGAALHIGRAPGELLEISPSIQLVALDEALEETLRREDYEGAAWLRDKIQRFKEGAHEGNEG